MSLERGWLGRESLLSLHGGQAVRELSKVAWLIPLHIFSFSLIGIFV